MNRKTPRRSDRSRKRGVAMVEGVVVLPILTMFFVLNVFMMGTIDRKIFAQRIAREEAMFFASHSCQVSEGIAQEAVGIATGMLNGPPAGAAGGKTQEKSGMVAADLIGGSSATVNSSFTYMGHSAPNIKGTSFALCNEQLWGGSGSFSSLWGFFQFGVTTIAQIFGLRI